MPEHRNHLGQPVGAPVAGWSPRRDRRGRR